MNHLLALEAYARRADRFNVMFNDLWKLTGAPTATVKRLISSTSASVGVPPTDLYASGLTGLRVIAKTTSSVAPRVRNTDASLPDTPLLPLTFFNFAPSTSDVIEFRGKSYSPSKLSGTTPQHLYTLSGEALTLAGQAPPTPTVLCCGLSIKPETAITLTITFVDQEGQTKTSDIIEIATDAKLQDYYPILVNSALVSIKSVTSATLVSGTVGAGTIYISPGLPFLCHAFLVQLD